MEGQPSEISAREFLLRLDAISREKSRVRYSQIQQSMQSTPETVSAQDFCKIIDFSADQLGRWEAEWLFSPASNPDSDAAREKKAWAAAWKTVFDALIKVVPELGESLNKEKDLVCIRIVMEKRMEYLKGKPVAKFSCNILSRAGLRLLRMGPDSTGYFFYKRALFPPGTVGRLNY